MRENGLHGRFVNVALLSTALAGCLTWFGVSRWPASPFWQLAVVVMVMTILFLVLRHVHQASVSRIVERSWKLAGEKVELNESLAKLESTFIATLNSMGDALDRKDSFTAGHSRRVADIAVKIGRAMGLADAELENLERAARLHDIGKLWVSDDILNKEGPLTSEELSVIRKHPVVGAEILDSFPTMKGEASAILYHHERFDGHGYPYGLKGLAIPLEARIMAVADAFDAMTSERPFRGALLLGDALEELYNNAGSQFDPRVVEAFLNVLEDITREVEFIPNTEKRFGARLFSMVGNC